VGLGLAYGTREDKRQHWSVDRFGTIGCLIPPYMLRLLSIPNLPLPKNTTEAIQEN